MRLVRAIVEHLHAARWHDPFWKFLIGFYLMRYGGGTGSPFHGDWVRVRSNSAESRPPAKRPSCSPTDMGRPMAGLATQWKGGENQCAPSRGAAVFRFILLLFVLVGCCQSRPTSISPSVETQPVESSTVEFNAKLAHLLNESRAGASLLEGKPSLADTEREALLVKDLY
jgi:hypothetical protein